MRAKDSIKFRIEIGLVQKRSNWRVQDKKIFKFKKNSGKERISIDLHCSSHSGRRHKTLVLYKESGPP